MKKPKWVVEKEQARKAAASETVWLFGLHAVRDAPMNPKRQKMRLIVTRNAQDKLADAIAESGMQAELVDPRKFSAPIDPGSVHQGAALEVKPLEWGGLAENCIGRKKPSGAAVGPRDGSAQCGRDSALGRGSGRQRGDRHAPPFGAGNRCPGQDRQRGAGAPTLSAGAKPG